MQLESKLEKRVARPFLRHLSAVALCLASLPSFAASPPSFLHTQGQDIVNENGDKVLLRGVSLGNWFLPEGYMWKFGGMGDRPRKIEKIVSDLIGPEDARRFWSEYRQNYITEADIQRIAELGYNSVRPALNSRLFLTPDGVPDESGEGFQVLDHLVAWSRGNGIYVIIDMHAAPGGQTGQNIDDSANDQPELFINPKYQTQLVDLWCAIARRYKDEPAVAGYDLLNEPLPERTGAAHAYKAQLEPLYKRVTKAIRQIDTRHLVVVEGADWANDWSVFTAPFDRNMVYQFHYYCWDNPSKLKSIERYLKARDRFNAPVWVGETGEKDDAIYWATTQYFEANNIGWSFWPWKKMATQNTPYSITPPDNWTEIAAYSDGGDKPSREVAKKALDQLLNNIRLQNCVFFPDVVHAMLREVPGKIEAENFDMEGQNSSYFVKDPKQLSSFYRLSEPVPIKSDRAGRRQSQQYIELGATEWTAYTVHSTAPGSYALTMRAKAKQTPCEIRVTVGERALTMNIANQGWNKIDLGTVALAQGANHLKWYVTSGVADLDWLDLEPTAKPQQASHADTTVLP